MSEVSKHTNHDAGAHFESLDGFRGIAALFVLFFHSMFPWFRPLWIGVPMFFVLSGFLITRILLTNKGSAHELKTFYSRRTLRIFPVYYFALLISALWGLSVHADFTYFPAFLLYLQNFTISADFKPEYCYGLMNHTWSLSVEELFYLLWPLIVLYVGTSRLTSIIVLIGGGSILYKIIQLCFFYTSSTDQLLLLSMTGNLDGLMAGCLLATLRFTNTGFFQTMALRKYILVVSLIFLFVFAANYFHYDQLFFFSIFKESLSTITTILSFFALAWLLSTTNSKTVLNKIFQCSFLRFTGKISYGLYLYHALVFGIMDACLFHFKINVGPVFVFAIKLLLSYTAAILSWRLIEAPFLKLKNKYRY